MNIHFAPGSLVPIKEILKIIGARAHTDAMTMDSARIVSVLCAVSAEWDRTTGITIYFGGKWDTKDGERVLLSWSAFGRDLSEYAENVVPKGMGTWFTPALSHNGGCFDVDIESVTQLSFDNDGHGEWDRILSLLDASGLAYLVQRSSRSTAERPKWHLHIPLAKPYGGPKPLWRAIYRHTVAWWSVIAGLNHEIAGEPPLYGFDPGTDRLGQPWFPSTRRDAASAPPEILLREGTALDLEKFLELTGFDPVQSEQDAIAMLPKRERVRKRRAQRRARAVTSGSNTGEGLLVLAFREAGMLGQRIEPNKHAVICPWAQLHTTGHDFDSSSVVFDAAPGQEVGWYHCRHSHCLDRSLPEVLAALPHGTVARAEAALRGVQVVPSWIAGRVVEGPGQ